MATQRLPNYTEFVRSFSNELRAVENRVRHLIGVGHHNAEEGRYKEIILSEILRSSLPENIGIGTGFVLCDDKQVSSQIDIILYDKSKNAEVLKKGNFVIVLKQSVLGIIEVKTTLRSCEMKGIIDKLCENKAKIDFGKNDKNKFIFVGLFGYHFKNDNNGYENIHNEIDDIATNKGKSDKKFMNFVKGDNMVLENALKDNFLTKEPKEQFINCIAFGKDYFVKFWEKKKPFEHNLYEHYSFYGIRDLSFGYFISNLKEHIRLLTKVGVKQKEYKLLYPLENEGGKEHYRKDDLEIEFKNSRTQI